MISIEARSRAFSPWWLKPKDCEKPRERGSVVLENGGKNCRLPEPVLKDGPNTACGGNARKPGVIQQIVRGLLQATEVLPVFFFLRVALAFCRVIDFS